MGLRRFVVRAYVSRTAGVLLLYAHPFADGSTCTCIVTGSLGLNKGQGPGESTWLGHGTVDSSNPKRNLVAEASKQLNGGYRFTVALTILPCVREW